MLIFEQGGVQYTPANSVGNNGSFQSSVAVGSGVGSVIGMGTGSLPVSTALHPGGTVTLATGTLAGTLATQSFVTMSTPSSLQSPTNTVSTINPAQVSVQGIGTGMAVPYQLSQQQAQMLFAQPGGTGQPHQQSPQHQPKK